MKLEKQRSGPFVPGGTGTYILTVSNAGTLDVTGDICVTDCLPEGLTYQSYTPVGDWNCALGACPGTVLQCGPQETAVMCTTGKDLPVGGSLPAITLLVHISESMPAFVVNFAEVSTDGDVFQPDDPASDASTFLPVPAAGTAGLVLIAGALAYLAGRRLLGSRPRR